MMKNFLLIFTTLFTYFASLTASADIVSSNVVIEQQRFEVSKQRILAMVDTKEVQQKLTSLGVTTEEAKKRIQHLTPQEVSELNVKINDAPAGSGIVGTVVTVLVVVAVLDMLGVTDAYSFIDPV